MRTSRKILLLCVVFLFVTRPPAFAVSASANQTARRYAYAAYRLSKWHLNSEAIVYNTAAIKADPSLWEAYVNRAACYLESREWSKAIQDCDAALKIKPTDADAHYVRAVALFYSGRDAECMSDLEKAARAKPSEETRHSIAQLQARVRENSPDASSGEVRKSLAELDRAVAQAQGTSAKAEALNSRAWFRAVSHASSARDGGKAVADALEACRLSNWKDKDYIDTLAAAYAEKGDFQSAVRTGEQAIAMAAHNRKSLPILRRHLAAYERHQPYRLTPVDRAEQAELRVNW